MPVDPATHHWFIGDGMVRGVRLAEGRAHWYRNRWVRSTAVSEALGEAPAPGDDPVARIHLPARVPLGFHGNWAPDQA